MRHIARNATLFIAVCAVTTGAMSQKVYRCGSSYSQIPCADGGVPIETQDVRTQAQKSQADALTRSDAATAKSMEKERLQQEARTLQTTGSAKNIPAEPKKPSKVIEQPKEKSVPVSSRLEAGKSTGGKNSKKEPEYFTAQTASAKKKAASSAPN